ncbi:hypothetical protein BOX15_Mlig020079g1 [Macrostomum lignano]|uniref:Uncharacterized protein n=1 Tax=Macrostomum lignano TaxID=282301 RepID=A0A267FD65_9PLAT|nr:hypothetical protein BOX15_Mlig020079g1 [Macrostomum lignano]
MTRGQLRRPPCHGAAGGRLPLLALLVVCCLSAVSAAATTPQAEETINEMQAADFVHQLDSRLGARGQPRPEKRANPMNCNQRCERGDILVFKAYWRRHYSHMNFVDFLRDLVVYSAYYPELRAFKPLVDQAVQNYELCRYVTCSTDYLGPG